MKYKTMPKTRIPLLAILLILTTLLTACTARPGLEPLPPTETPTSIPDTPTTIPSSNLPPTAAPTVTSTPLSPDAQALKDIIFSPCIPVEQSLPDDIEISWNLLAMQGGSVFIFDPEDGTKVEIPHFTEKTSESYNKYLFEFSISPDGKWLAYPDIPRKKLFIESVETLLTNGDAKRIVLEKGHRFFMHGWINNSTVLVIYPPSEEGGFFPTVILNPFTGEEHEFSLEEMPNFLDFHFSNTSNYMIGEVVPDPTLKKLIYPERGKDGIYNVLWDIENEKPLARLQFLVGKINDPLWSQDGSDVLLMGPNQNLK